jgi:hypothetical protein
MDSLFIIDQLLKQKDFSSANGDVYQFNSYIDDLFDMKQHFYVFIEGRVNIHHRLLIDQAIYYTWNLTAYQSKNFVQYYKNNYEFTFLPSNELYVDTDGKLQTKIIFFISSRGKLACEDDFDLLPKTDWIQDSMRKYDFIYSVLDGKDRSVKPYNSLYFVDFDSHIDPSYENHITQTILAEFRRAYKDIEFISLSIVMKERRIGEYGNNVTRLLYYLEDIEDNLINLYEYAAPHANINVSFLAFLNLKLTELY